MLTNDQLINHVCCQHSALDNRIIEAMSCYSRDQFIQHNTHAFDDAPLDIGYGQTATAPSLIAAILDIAQIQPEHRVLEIGTGSGYQTALIAHISKHVTSLDIVAAFTQHAQNILQQVRLTNIDLRTQDGRISCNEGVFDRIIINAAVRQVPPVLLAQLQTNGLIIAPVDKRFHKQKIAIISESDPMAIQTTSIRAGFLGLTELRGNDATV